MVGQEILVLFIMVRIRALQPEIKTPLVGIFYFCMGCCRYLATQRSCLVRNVAKRSERGPTRSVGNYNPCASTKKFNHPFGCFLYKTSSDNKTVAKGDCLE